MTRTKLPPDHWFMRDGWHWYWIVCAVVWCAIAAPCLIVGPFLCGWLALPLTALFATMLTARIMEGIAV